MPIQIINPATGELIKRHPEMAPAHTQEIISLAHEEYLSWKLSTFDTRAKLMKNAAQILRQGKEGYAKTMAIEMGKPITQGLAEVEKCAWVCEYYAENAERFLADKEIPTQAAKSFITYQPLGVVLAVMPWNFPFWQVFRFAAPTLMAGNCGLLKHASNVPDSALAIEQVFAEAGFPKNVFRTLLIGSPQVDAVIHHPKVVAVTLTGSTLAGKAVAASAGAALKKTVLELGGSDPYIILKDADLEKAANACALSRLINSGQSCIAAKRFIVDETVKLLFENLFVQQMKAAKMGDPLQPDTQVGPQARIELRNELHAQVRTSVEKGARLLLGGNIPAGPGAFYPPTVLTDVMKGMPAFDEEVFGPVAAIISAKDTEDAIRIANDSVFGLGAAIFTSDVEAGQRIAREQLQAGCCFVNDFVKSDPRLPFGGIKESGYGRELSALGIREFVNIKTVSLT